MKCHAYKRPQLAIRHLLLNCLYIRVLPSASLLFGNSFLLISYFPPSLTAPAYPTKYTKNIFRKFVFYFAG